ncbi:MAG: CAP domain-containing protein [Sphingobacteriia bacterium]|nr:MAG: CAP domain-containing protein [Sphingobacteriia bacterium]
MPLFRLALFCFILLNSMNIMGQTHGSVTLISKPFKPNIAESIELLTQLEQNTIYLYSDISTQSFIYWTNFSRLYPQKFRDSILIPFINEQPAVNGSYSNSLLDELASLDPLPFLMPEQLLTNAASKHAVNIIKNGGRISHQSANGTSFSDRIKLEGIKFCAAENIFNGANNDALVALLLLYLDIGLPNLGHRKNLLNANYTQMGLGLGILPNKYYLIVQDFGCTPSVK